MTTGTIAISLPATLRVQKHAQAERADDARPPVEAAALAEPMDEFDHSDEHSKNGDDLRQIKGIGPVIVEVLARQGIDRYAKLASFTPDHLASLLRAEIPTITSRRIERDDWIGQAEALAHGSSRKRESPPTLPEADHTAGQSARGRQKAPTRTPRESWRELADFFVSFGFAIGPEGVKQFRTRVHHSQAGDLGEWDGLVTDELVDWMLRHANLSRSAGANVVPATRHEDRVEIVKVQTSRTLAPLGIWASHLVVEVGFRISGPEAEALAADRIPFRIEVYTVNLESGDSNLAASGESRLQPQTFEYTSQHACLMPEVGRYELHTLVLLLPPAEMVAFHKGPAIRVTP